MHGSQSVNNVLGMHNLPTIRCYIDINSCIVHNRQWSSYRTSMGILRGCTIVVQDADTVFWCFKYSKPPCVHVQCLSLALSF